jgi:hypothetical protein
VPPKFEITILYHHKFVLSDKFGSWQDTRTMLKSFTILTKNSFFNLTR